MELRHLAAFVAVAEERSFTRASERLHTVQSGVSAAIRALEGELGSVLLERNSRHVDLTDAGAVLLPHARATLDAARAAREAMDEVRGGLRGHLRVGTMTALHHLDLAGLLAEFRRRYPLVTVQLVMKPSGSEGLIEALRAGEVDLAFVSLPGAPPAGVDIRPLGSTPLDLVLPATHRLAGRAAGVRLAELADEEFIEFPAGYGNRAAVELAFAVAGVARRVTLEVNDFATAARFVGHGLGVALLPRFAIPEDPAMVRLPVRGADLLWPVGAATSRTRTLAGPARAMLGLLDRFVD